MSLGHRLKEARIMRRLTQAQLAERSGVGQTTIGNMEKRGSQASKYAEALANALDVDVNWLITGNGSMGGSPSEPLPHYNKGEAIERIFPELLKLHNIQPTESNAMLVKMLKHHLTKLLEEEPGAELLSAKAIWTLIEGELSERS